MKVMFIGGGNIANIVIEELKDYIDECWYFDISPTNLSEKKELKCHFLENFEIPVEADIVVESASVEAVKNYSTEVLKSGKDFYIISSGAFADEEFFDKFFEKLKNSNSNVFIPSGAIGGIDIIYAIRKYIDFIILTMRKPPKAFGLDNIQSEQIVFLGNAKEAIKRFPQNTNVSVTLSLSVGSFEKVNVKILADPSISENIHEITVHSKVGNYTIIHKNIPSPNPKTSYLAPLSLAACIRKRLEKMKIG